MDLINLVKELEELRALKQLILFKASMGAGQTKQSLAQRMKEIRKACA